MNLFAIQALACAVALRPQSKGRTLDAMMRDSECKHWVIAPGNRHHAFCFIAHPDPIHPRLLTNAVHYRLRLSWDRVLDPKAQHIQLDKRVRGAQANVDLSHILPSGSALHSDASISAQDSDDDAQAVSKLFYLHLCKCLLM